MSSRADNMDDSSQASVTEIKPEFKQLWDAFANASGARLAKSGIQLPLPPLQNRAEFEKTRQRALFIFGQQASNASLHQFFFGLPKVMCRLIRHDFAVVIFADAQTNTFGPAGFGIEINAVELDRNDAIAAANIFNRANPEDISRLLPATEFSALGMKLQGWLLDNNVAEVCCAPLTSQQQSLGVLILCSKDENRFMQPELDLAGQVATAMALAFENLRSHEALRQERVKLQLLQRVNTILASEIEFLKVIPAIAELVREVIPYDHASVAVFDRLAQSLKISFLYDLGAKPETPVLLASNTLAGLALQEGRPKVFTREDLTGERTPYGQHLLAHGTQSLCCVPLITTNGQIGTLNLASTEAGTFQQASISLLQQLAVQVALVVDNAGVHREIKELKDKLACEKIPPDDEIRHGDQFEDIIGESNALKHVLTAVKIVAPSDANVLILGETGTGKELVARAIHKTNARRNAVFAKLNCAAIPTGLLESELFGHEKGAFTGAVSQKLGRLELADRGTLFLDEVGDIPLELQPKLLRVLQDQEFERLGGTRTIRVNVRLIAATNRDLDRAVEESKFRRDLFYRLNVFPIRVPSLRERKQDIPLLVHYFVKRFALRMKKTIEKIPARALQALQHWDWPGNIRELENFIERTVILTEGPVLTVPLSELESIKPLDDTLETLEKERIIRALREARGIIAGVHGAAARLGMKRTTLQSKVTRMRISLDDYK